MRMSAGKMRKIAKMHPKMSVTAIAKQELTFEGNKTFDYSFKEDLRTCRKAVIRAIKWAKKDAKRFALKLRGSV